MPIPVIAALLLAALAAFAHIWEAAIAIASVTLFLFIFAWIATHRPKR